jgi:putative tryptophan/tyrosine transport system substrate-binding protein
MRRREFLGVLGGSTIVAWPLAALAQHPVIGFVSTRSPSESASVEAAFRKGLGETGYIEGHNVHIAFRWAEGQYDRLPSLAADLVDRHVAVIAAFGPPAALAAKAATSTIPIVFSVGVDPLAVGLVGSINRPGGNVTGATFFSGPLAAKRLGLLREFLQKIELLAFLVNPEYPNVESQVNDVETAAGALGQRVLILKATSIAEIDAAFASLARQRANALMVGGDPFFDINRKHIIASAAHQAVPAIYHWHEYVVGGGLMSYGASIGDAYRQVGVYAGRVLKGEKPAGLPVMQPTKFDMAINHKTAKALGLVVPPTLLALADEVIE